MGYFALVHYEQMPVARMTPKVTDKSDLDQIGKEPCERRIDHTDIHQSIESASQKENMVHDQDEIIQHEIKKKKKKKQNATNL